VIVKDVRNRWIDVVVSACGLCCLMSMRMSESTDCLAAVNLMFVLVYHCFHGHVAGPAQG
jgi:hypothetical protein